MVANFLKTEGSLCHNAGLQHSKQILSHNVQVILQVCLAILQEYLLPPSICYSVHWRFLCGSKMAFTFRVVCMVRPRFKIIPMLQCFKYTLIPLDYVINWFAEVQSFFLALKWLTHVNYVWCEATLENNLATPLEVSCDSRRPSASQPSTQMWDTTRDDWLQTADRLLLSVSHLDNSNTRDCQWAYRQHLTSIRHVWSKY